MKRQFMKGLMSLCAGVMTLCAASSLFVSCYDDSALQQQISELDKRVQNLESLQTQLAELTARVDALYTLQFREGENKELQYSFDGGQEWKHTGIFLAKETECQYVPCDHECPPCQYVPCDHECPEVSLVDNGDSVTIKVGDAEFTIEKPQQVSFELRAGKVYFQSEGTATVAIKSAGIDDITVISYPKGWYAEINPEGKVEVTAPNYDETQPDIDYETWTEIPAKCAASGYVKVHACSTEGKCMVGKLPVEVVAQALSVKAYDGNAYFSVATDYAWGPTFFYGATTRENLEAETAGLIKGLTDSDYSVYDEYLQNYEETNIVASIEELLGEEPQLGEEYVVWAIMEDYNKVSYSAEDIVLAYYSPLQVTLEEVEAEKTAYNVTVNVEVVGAEGYVAVALPGMYCDDPEYTAEQMTYALAEGQYYGKYYTTNYCCSALDIAAGTTYSMTGLYSPASDVYVFVLPIDGRPVEDYTAADVVMGQFTTAELTAGGSVDLAVEQITSYWGEVYDYDIYEYVSALIELDPYTQLGVKLERSSNDAWSALYFNWLDEQTYNEFVGYDEDLVDYLLETSYGNLPGDVKSWPLYLTENVAPNTTKHFVAFVVDATGKYGKVAHIELTSEELEKAEFTWAEPVKTNVVDGVLKNTQTLEITPAFEEGTEPAKYKYVLAQTKYYNQYEGMDDAQMAEELYFSTSSSVKTVTAEELVNGVLYVDGHSYGYPYYFAIVPIDAEGRPGASAYIMEYETVFAIENVNTGGAEFEATKPAIEIFLPEESEFYPDGEWGDAAYYGYEYQDYYSKYNFYYEIAYSVTPAEGTEVCSVLVDTDSYTLGADAATKAGQVWGGTLGSWNTNTTTEFYESSYRYFSHYEDEPAPALVLCVSWKDAAGTLYYKEYQLQESMQHYADLMLAKIYGETEPEEPAELTIEGKQWSFEWELMGNAPVRLDVGVSMNNYCMIGLDLGLFYPDDPGAAGLWQAYVEGYYEIEKTSETAGKIWLMQADWVTGDLTRGFSIDYSDLTEDEVTLDCEMYGLMGTRAFLCSDNVTIYSQGIAM